MALLVYNSAPLVRQCPVLSELSPAASQAVSGRADAQQFLESLYRRKTLLPASVFAA